MQATLAPQEEPFMRTGNAKRALVAACFLTLLAAPTQAAQIVAVSYTVTGGTFSGLNLSGDITGGSVTYNAPPPFLSTSTRCFGLGDCGSIVSLVLTGPAGTWSLLAPLQVATASIYPTVFHGGFTRGFYNQNKQAANFQSGASMLSEAIISTAFARVTYSNNNIGAIRYSGTSPGMNHAFTIGNEIRTVVPEPEPGITALVSLGLLGLLFAWRGQRELWRPRGSG
jgi:hypothetical protein